MKADLRSLREMVTAFFEDICKKENIPIVGIDSFMCRDKYHIYTLSIRFKVREQDDGENQGRSPTGN